MRFTQTVLVRIPASIGLIFTEGMRERLTPNDWLRNWTHAEVDACADIIVMHGAPLHGVEIYDGRPIFYDSGNVIYNVPPTLTNIVRPVSAEVSWPPVGHPRYSPSAHRRSR